MEGKRKHLSKALMVDILSTILGMVLSVLATFSTDLLTAKSPRSYITILALFIFMVLSMTYSLLLFRRGPSRIQKLKAQLVDAYLKALRASPINPSPEEN